MAVSWSSEATLTTLRWMESPNGGALWFEPSTVSTNASSRQRNDWPSVVWPTATTRYVVWNGWTENTNYYRLYMRKGTGMAATPSAVLSTTMPWTAGANKVTVADPGTIEGADGQAATTSGSATR
jgi:hypothetical protein